LIEKSANKGGESSHLVQKGTERMSRGVGEKPETRKSADSKSADKDKSHDVGAVRVGRKGDPGVHSVESSRDVENSVGQTDLQVEERERSRRETVKKKGDV